MDWNPRRWGLLLHTLAWIGTLGDGGLKQMLVYTVGLNHKVDQDMTAFQETCSKPTVIIERP